MLGRNRFSQNIIVSAAGLTDSRAKNIIILLGSVREMAEEKSSLRLFATGRSDVRISVENMLDGVLFTRLFGAQAS